MEYVVIDTESCTGRSDDGSLCSIGYAICDENFNVLQKEDLLINPLPKRFSVGDKKNAKRTGVTFSYTVEEFRRAPRFNEIYNKVKEIFTDRTVIGFSMANDVKYLNNACDSFNLPRIEYFFYDVQFIYQLLFPDETSVGLKTLNEKYKIEYVEHRSDEDAVGSLILLKKFLDNLGFSFDEVIKKYGIHAGENTVDGYHIGFSDAIIQEKFGLKRSKRIQGIIFSDYIKKLPKRSCHEKVCFSYKIERSDVNFVRSLIDLIYSKEWCYTHDTDICTVYVTDEEDDKRLNYLSLKQRKKIRTLSLSEFKILVGYEKDFDYDDSKFLTAYYKTKIK